MRINNIPVGVPRFELGSHKFLIEISTKCPQHSGDTQCRGAENRTRILRTRSVRNAFIPHPDTVYHPKARILPLYYTPFFIIFSQLLSGCRESNSDYIHPMDAYYHYTTPRISNMRRLTEHTILHMIASKKVFLCGHKYFS